MNVVAQAAGDAIALLDVGEVSRLLGCSARHVYRLSDAGRMPAPVKLGALVRWNRAAVESWIDQGCPAVRYLKGASK
ncbi:MAG TPA: helix-turn-helix domain-containing protein [Pirellulales bacterium]|jgi:excisionase family DNA binding protein